MYGDELTAENGAETEPTIETVLNRINQLDERIESRFGNLESRFGGLESRFGGLEGRVERVESEISQLRLEVNTGFRRVERKIDLLNRDFLAIRADNEDLLQRVENLESQAS